MNDNFDYKMLQLLSNPNKMKSNKSSNNTDDILYKEIKYKFKNYNINKIKFDNILKLINNYLCEQQTIEIIDSIVNNIIEDVINENRNNKNNDARRNNRTLRKSQ